MKKTTPINYLTSIIVLLFISTTGFGQSMSNLSKADKAYNQYGYLDAREIYLKVAEKGYGSSEVYEKIANSYYFNAQYKEAMEWYDKFFDAIDFRPGKSDTWEETEESGYRPNPMTLLRYAQSLRANGKDNKAERYFNSFAEETGKQTEGRSLTAADYLKLIRTNSGRYKVKKLDGVNTAGIEFGHSMYEGKLVYASTRDTGVFMKRKSSWDGLSFLELYQVEIAGDSVAGTATKIPGEVNDKFHESSAAFSADGKTMYFTRSNSNPEEKEENQKLKIYRAHLIDGEWTKIEDLPINSDAYSTAHPALDSAGTRLYFASDRPGGYGESDLYMASIGEDGSIGKAENLGAEINTAGKETFPFVSTKGELYFSSDGHYGLGGLDVFYTKIETFGFGNLLNIGAPVNSYADDFAFGIDFETKKGFFSSNRGEGEEATNFVYDNIYRLEELEEIIDVYKALIYGQVTDAETGEPIAGATVSLYHAEADSLYASVTTDEEGKYEQEVNYYDAYRVRAEHNDYDPEEKLSEPEQREQEINFALERNRLALTPGTDIGPLLKIDHILFDFDKSNIRPDAQVELEKLITVMEEYPELKIAIRSHTDSRGSDAYNRSLSDRRAKSTLEYLVDNGISRDRLTAKGFGESELKNECSNGVDCTAAQHQENRRSEFVVTEYKPAK